MERAIEILKHREKELLNRWRVYNQSAKAEKKSGANDSGKLLYKFADETMDRVDEISILIRRMENDTEHFTTEA